MQKECKCCWEWYESFLLNLHLYGDLVTSFFRSLRENYRKMIIFTLWAVPPVHSFSQGLMLRLSVEPENQRDIRTWSLDRENLKIKWMLNEKLNWKRKFSLHFWQFKIKPIGSVEWKTPVLWWLLHQSCKSCLVALLTRNIGTLVVVTFTRTNILIRGATLLLVHSLRATLDGCPLQKIVFHS